VLIFNSWVATGTTPPAGGGPPKWSFLGLSIALFWICNSSINALQAA
jgi:hypothetical protein